ncbi:hypothetical protein [Pseudonocardia sp.]|uniref:hypothetical protein n=1 Tax=Pseudonocardia sp. TaxID=60912 RepID=UPI003D141FC6
MTTDDLDVVCGVCRCGGKDIGMTDERWMLVFESSRERSVLPVGLRVQVGQSLRAGRHGDLPVGVELDDRGISRNAATVTATETGWAVEITNTHGAVVHPWAQAPFPAAGHQTLSWPRVAIRLLNGAAPGGEAAGHRHWLLLEADGIPVEADGPRRTANTTSRTAEAERPPELTPSQHEALALVFAEYLQWWPIRPDPAVRKLYTVAHRLKISETGVKARLSNAREKAQRLGLHRTVGLTDPEYLFTLVRAGFLPLRGPRPHRRLLY